MADIMERSSRHKRLFPNDPSSTTHSNDRSSITRPNDRSPTTFTSARNPSAREAPRRSKAREIVLVLGALSLLLLFTLRIASSFRGTEARASSAAHVAPNATAVGVDGTKGSPATDGSPGARAPMAPELAAAAIPSADSPAASDAESERLRADLTSAVESTVAGALDPEAIVNSALALLHSHVEKGVLPTTAPDGSLRYRLTPCPPGVQAELWVARSTGSKFEDVLSLRMKLAAPREPYYFEGAVRKDPVAYVQAFLDEAGRMKDLVIMTDVAPSGESRRFDINVLQGRMPQGIIFHVDTSRPDEWKASSYGLDDGADRTWDDPVAMLSDPRPAPDAIGQLASGLLGLLSEARR